MSILFSNIDERLKLPPNQRAKISSIHSDIIAYANDNHIVTRRLQRMLIDVINVVTYRFINGEHMPDAWTSNNPLVDYEPIDDDDVADFLKPRKCYVDFTDVEWDISDGPINAPNILASQPSNPANQLEKIVSSTSTTSYIKHPNSTRIDRKNDIKLTDKSDLYIQPPAIPTLDFSCPWATATIDGELWQIHPSLPRIPLKQSDISATTDVSNMTDSDIMKLYPNHFIRTRSNKLYEPIGGTSFHPQFGLIMPILDFEEQVLLQNIVEYPHIFQLRKMVDGSIVSFYDTVEIDQRLVPVHEAWNSLPELSRIPFQPDYVKEYVVRRYILERDILHIEHRYPMFGTLDPFLTLFMSADQYESLGYNTLDIAKACVKSRVSYKQSRNPILRRIQSNV